MTGKSPKGRLRVAKALFHIPLVNKRESKGLGGVWTKGELT